MQPTLKVVRPDDIKKQEENRGGSSRFTSKLFLLLKEGVKQYEFVEGTHNLRLVPQPNGAKETWTWLLKYCYLNKAITPNHFGMFAFTEEQAEKNREIQTYLYQSAWGPRMKRAKINPNGIDLGIKYRAMFYGFNYSEPAPQMLPILLPANAPKAPPGTRIQVGTRLKQFIYEKDIHNNYKYGDLVNLDGGRVIQINVVGSGDRREYIPSVDAVAPLVDASGNIIPRFESLITQVRPFEDVINYQSNEAFEDMILAKLHEDMREDIKTRFFSKGGATAPAAAAPAPSYTPAPAYAPTPAPAPAYVAPTAPAPAPVAAPAAQAPVAPVTPPAPAADELDPSKIDWATVTPEVMASPAFKAMLAKMQGGK